MYNVNMVKECEEEEEPLCGSHSSVEDLFQCMKTPLTKAILS